MKWVFVLNITSGQGKSIKEIDTIHKVMRRNNLDYEIVKTYYPGHAVEITRSYYPKDDVCIVSTGGDGTIFEVVNGLNDGVPMAVLPTGSGNDFFRLINDQNRPIEELLEELLDSYETNIDVCEARRDNNYYKFINCTSLGFDADINSDAVKIIKNTKINKGMAYNIGILKNLLSNKNKKINIQFDDEEEQQINCILIAAMNGKYYGNGFKPTPFADCQDGVLDVCYVDNFSLTKIVKLIPEYKKGTHTNIEGVHFKKCKRLKLTAKNKTNIQSDGENYDCFELEIKILEKALKIRVPKNSIHIK